MPTVTLCINVFKNVSCSTRLMTRDGVAKARLGAISLVIPLGVVLAAIRWTSLRIAVPIVVPVSGHNVHRVNCILRVDARRTVIVWNHAQKIMTSHLNNIWNGIQKYIWLQYQLIQMAILWSVIHFQSLIDYIYSMLPGWIRIFETRASPCSLDSPFSRNNLCLK